MLDIALLSPETQGVFNVLQSTPAISRTVKNLAAKTQLRRKVVKALLRQLQQTGHVTRTDRTPVSAKKRPVYSAL
jgi:hypothetical protein